MTTMCWRNAVTWSLLGLMFLLFALVAGPAPALASQEGDAALYEVTEDMYLKDSSGNFVTSPVPGGRRMAVAQLSGWAKVGTPLCPSWVLNINPGTKRCTVNASGADDLSLATGQGTLKGTYAVVVQGDNKADAPEFVIMTGTFKGDADLSLAFAGTAPLGFINNGVATIDGYAGSAFAFTGTFRLPFVIDEVGKVGKAKKNLGAWYVGDDGSRFHVRHDEKSLGVATVRIDIQFAQPSTATNEIADDSVY